MISKFALAALYAAAVSGSGENFVAINDLVPAGAARAGGICTWTQFTHGRNWKSGGGELASVKVPKPLVDTSGRKTQAKLELVEKTTHRMTINNAKNKVTVKKGTAAWEEYGACICDEEKDCNADGECTCDAFDGNLSYNDAPDWEFRYIFSGLNPQCEAEISFFVDRGSTGHSTTTDYDARYSLFTLEKATASTPQMSLALAILNNGSTLAIRSGENSKGHIAKWIGVKHHGTFEVVATHGSQSLVNQAGLSPPPHPYKGYAGGLLKLRQICAEEPIFATAANATTIDAKSVAAKTVDAEGSNSKTVDAKTVDAEGSNSKTVDAKTVEAEGSNFIMLIVGVVAAGAVLAMLSGGFFFMRRRTALKKTGMKRRTLSCVKADVEVADAETKSDASTRTPSDSNSVHEEKTPSHNSIDTPGDYNV